ncbi:NAD(P)H-quinone oxidoreductase [Ramlibacter solisilvae]|uniref:zinc-binding dehydrogenase n=1 Tax=Ramlibacter tataouinensis TaxID=94132 RepID=UPI0007778621|nr:zinc-binding dehydrogenase [Ramlibacter tataouinensis]
MQSWWMKLDDAGAMLEMRDAPVPQPGPGQLLVRMEAAGLNRGEFIAGHGLHGAAGAWKALGGEGAGEVVQLGAGVSTCRPGARVMGRCTGAFAEYALMNATEAMAVPARLSWEEAAAIPLTYLVAFDMLVLQGHLKPGEWLLVNGVSSGVGVASLQMGKALGAQVIGTSGSPDKLERLQALGLDRGLLTRSAGFAPQVMEITGQHGADLVVNAVGGSVFAENIRCMAFEGRLATVGYVDGVLNAELDLAALHAKRLTLFGVSNKLRSPAQRAAGVARFALEMLPRFASGAMRPQVDEVLPLDRLLDGKVRMETGGHLGKIVLRLGGRTASSMRAQPTAGVD